MLTILGQFSKAQDELFQCVRLKLFFFFFNGNSWCVLALQFILFQYLVFLLKGIQLHDFPPVFLINKIPLILLSSFFLSVPSAAFSRVFYGSHWVCAASFAVVVPLILSLSIWRLSSTFCFSPASSSSHSVSSCHLSISSLNHNTPVVWCFYRGLP